MSSRRLLGVAGLWGALLTLVILAMSVLLRLGTVVQAGEALTTLPADVELYARIAHRIAAAAVGLLAALALVAAVRERPLAPGQALAVAAVVLLTLLLAAIGRYTPGYRVDLVTVANVAGGIALAAAFWWLRDRPWAGTRPGDPLAGAALLLLLVLAAFGAGADAAAMRGERAFGPVHLWLAAMFLALALAVAWRARELPVRSASLAALAILQFSMGFVLVGTAGGRPMALAWTHAMIACLMALLLVGLASGRGGRQAPPA